MKKIKFTYLVNLNEIETLDDIKPAFALAKHNAGLAISDSELLDIVNYATECIGPDIYLMTVSCEKKQPWYKRFWNKLRGKK